MNTKNIEAKLERLKNEYVREMREIINKCSNDENLFEELVLLIYKYDEERDKII